LVACPLVLPRAPGLRQRPDCDAGL
jgi:hypothetical protein